MIKELKPTEDKVIYCVVLESKNLEVARFRYYSDALTYVSKEKVSLKIYEMRKERVATTKLVTQIVEVE